MKTQKKIIISCEHGGNRIPPEYLRIFRGKLSILQSHRGMDKGALVLARGLAARIKAPLFSSSTTRLLVDLNRSLHHRHLFSEFTRSCAPGLKTEILDNYYYPYRTNLENAVRKITENGETVLHFSIHSFTRKLGGELRRTDIGLLYDPQRPGEQALCRNLQAILRNTSGGLVVRRNYPYRGSADGLTTGLRKRYGARKYLGIEIEINQKHVVANSANWSRLRQQIIDSVEIALHQ
jgi:predicted N-formylglutamate amidohydrolase